MASRVEGAPEREGELVNDEIAFVLDLRSYRLSAIKSAC